MKSSQPLVVNFLVPILGPTTVDKSFGQDEQAMEVCGPVEGLWFAPDRMVSRNPRNHTIHSIGSQSGNSDETPRQSV